MLFSSLLRSTARVLEPESMDSWETAILYDKVARAHTFLDKLFVRRVVKLGVRDGRVLDVGCGTGLLSIELSRAAPKLSIFALDLSETMLELAEQNATEADVENITFILADAKALPFADENFDIVLSHHTVHHVPKPERLLLEMKRVTKKGGYVVVRDLRRPRWQGLIDLYLRTLGHIYDGLGSSATAAKSLYEASLRAAPSATEWIQLCQRCGIPRSCVSNVPFLSHTDVVFHKDLNHDLERNPRRIDVST